MTVNTIQFRDSNTITGSADTKRRPSPAIWHDCPIGEIMRGECDGIYFYDNFVDYPLIGTQTTQIGHGKYKVFATAGSSVSKEDTINSVVTFGGALQLATDTDNDSASIAQAYPSFRLSGDKSTSDKLWFECCVSQNSIATNMAASFVGLAETDLWTLATGVPFNGGDAITNSASAIGFRVEEDGLGVIDTVYSDRATSFTNIGDTEGGTHAAFTFRKLGFVYDPRKTDDCIIFYANGVPLTTRLSKTTLTGLTNLDAGPLGLIWAACADSGGTSFEAYMKWWACGQVAAAA